MSPRPHLLLSIPCKCVRNEIGRFLSESVLLDRPVVGDLVFLPPYLVPLQVAFPRLRVEYVNLDSMVARHRQDIDEMKKLFGYHHPEGTVFQVR